VKVLFDHNVPKKLRSLLPGHAVSTSRELGWDTLKNGDLLATAEANGFEAMVTGDKNISHQQNLEGRKLALIVLPITDWGTLRENPAPIVAALDEATPGSFKALPALLSSARRPRGPSLNP
jgi:predicted nuclease of predicted toxin-antitoxin system